MAIKTGSKASSIDDYYKKTGYQRHKFFWQVLFSIFLLIGISASYIAVQQQQVLRSKATVACTGKPQAQCLATAGCIWKFDACREGVCNDLIGADNCRLNSCVWNGNLCRNLCMKFTQAQCNGDCAWSNGQCRKVGDGGGGGGGGGGTCAAPAKPTNLTPQDGTTIQKGTRTISWNAVTGADRYYVTINNQPFAEGGELSCPENQQGGENGDRCVMVRPPEHTFQFNFNGGPNYRVRVRAEKACGGGAFSRSEFEQSVVHIASDSAIPTNTPTPTPTTDPDGPTNTPTPDSNEPTNTPRPGETVDLNLALSASFQGVVGKPAGVDTMSVRVTLAGGALNENRVSQVQLTVNDSGVWSGETTFEDVPKADGYYLLVKGPKHLQKRVCDLEPSETAPGTYSCFDGEISVNSGEMSADLTGIKLLVGDLPEQDGIVDAYDTSLVRNIVAKPLDERKADENVALADLNFDGIVDSQDFSLVISALSVRSDEE